MFSGLAAHSNPGGMQPWVGIPGASSGTFSQAGSMTPVPSAVPCQATCGAGDLAPGSQALPQTSELQLLCLGFSLGRMWAATGEVPTSATDGNHVRDVPLPPLQQPIPPQALLAAQLHCGHPYISHSGVVINSIMPPSCHSARPYMLPAGMPMLQACAPFTQPQPRHPPAANSSRPLQSSASPCFPPVSALLHQPLHRLVPMLLDQNRRHLSANSSSEPHKGPGVLEWQPRAPPLGSCSRAHAALGKARGGTGPGGPSLGGRPYMRRPKAECKPWLLSWDPARQKWVKVEQLEPVQHMHSNAGAKGAGQAGGAAAGAGGAAGAEGSKHGVGEAPRGQLRGYGALLDEGKASDEADDDDAGGGGAGVVDGDSGEGAQGTLGALACTTGTAMLGLPDVLGIGDEP